MENPVADIASPIAKMLPAMLKIDALAQTGVLWWYLSNMTGLPDQQIYVALGLNAVTHGLFHSIACNNQDSIWTTSP